MLKLLFGLQPLLLKHHLTPIKKNMTTEGAKDTELGFIEINAVSFLNPDSVLKLLNPRHFSSNKKSTLIKSAFEF